MPQIIRRMLVMLLVLITVACTVPANHNSTPPSLVPQTDHELGVSDNLAHLPDDVLDARLTTLRDAGVKWVRKDIEWRGAERQQNHYDWSVNDGTVAAISKFGIKPLLILDYAPNWAAGPNHPDCVKANCAPADTPTAIAAFGAFAGAAAKHYCIAPYNVQALEIWNEPNLSKYWPVPSPSLYVKVLKAAHDAIKASGCSVKILLGGLGDTNCTGCLSSQDFLTGVYANGGKGLFDAVGSHPYIDGIPTPQTWQPLVLHDTMASHGDGNKQVWATEFAYSSQRIGADKQAQYMQEAIRTFRDYPWAGPLFWFTFQDASNSGGFGLVDTSGRPKPALAKLSELAHKG